MDNHCDGKKIIVKSSKNKLHNMWICKTHNSTNINNIRLPIYAKVWLNSCIFILGEYITDDYDISDADTIILDDEDMIMINDNYELREE